MLEQGITIVKEKKSVYGTVSYGEAVTILFQKRTEIFRARRFTG